MVLALIFKVFLALGSLFAGVLYYFCPNLFKDSNPPVLEDQYYGKQQLLSDGDIPEDDPVVKKYVIHVDDAALEDLKRRLTSTRFVDPLENSKFQYGFNGDYLKRVVNYWNTKYDWRQQEDELNKFDHYTTQIEGLNLHFIHQKPAMSNNKKVRVIPLLLIHGWPGSVVEFRKMLPLLTNVSKDDMDFVFEVVCPSIPGYGFSEAPHKIGFTAMSAARIFAKLMQRLGFEKYYIQGGDWGSIIASTIGKVYPERVLGVHKNLLTERMDVIGYVKYAVGYFFPAMFTTPDEYEQHYPFMKFVYFYLQETGYSHIQATKPDTVASALADSPAGLAAYILEKFSTWTNPSYKDLEDGGLLKRFELDDLLTNVMVYWCTNTIGSSVRLYKETFSELYTKKEFTKAPLLVPTGLAIFPHEIRSLPKALLPRSLRNVVRYTRMSEGGHFPALEVPELLSSDLHSFVFDVEKMRRDKIKND